MIQTFELLIEMLLNLETAVKVNKGSSQFEQTQKTYDEQIKKMEQINKTLFHEIANVGLTSEFSRATALRDLVKQILLRELKVYLNKANI